MLSIESLVEVLCSTVGSFRASYDSATDCVQFSFLFCLEKTVKNGG